MTPLKEAALDWVRRTLAEELRDESATAGTRAEGLIAIAEHYKIPIEDLIIWIRTPLVGKQWSGAEFRRFAEMYDVERKEALQLKEGDEWRKLCPQCHAEVAHRVASVWRCPRCGELPAEGAKA
jgi:ribosomal protein L37AE/L43A